MMESVANSLATKLSLRDSVTSVPIPKLPLNASEIHKKIYQDLVEFVNNPNVQEKSFSTNVTLEERKVIHELCDLFLIEHQSTGKGQARYLKITKKFFPIEWGNFNLKINGWATSESINRGSDLKTIKLVSYNVLFDIPSPKGDFSGIIYTDQRTPHLLEILKQSDADIIALQEMTPELHKKLIEQPWLKQVEKKYHVSDYIGSSVEPCGNVILSKFPLEKVYLYKYSRSQKRVLFAEVFINGQRTVLVGVHFKAGNYQEHGAARKAMITETLTVVKAITERGSNSDDVNWIIIGDFNFRDESGERNEELETHFIDVWTQMYPNDIGYTYDLEKNPLAKAVSDRITLTTKRSGASCRFDRILIRKGEQFMGRWEIEKLEMIGTEPIWTSPKGEPIFVSDHFGLQLQLRFCK